MSSFILLIPLVPIVSMQIYQLVTFLVIFFKYKNFKESGNNILASIWVKSGFMNFSLSAVYCS